jgi:hypothetical protein
MAAITRAENVPADDRVRQRVAQVARVFRYGCRMIEALNQYRRFEETGDPQTLAAAIAARDEAFGLMKESNAARRTASWVLTSEIGVPATGFGPAETKEGRRCWNSDETGVGDSSNGWATFLVRVTDHTRPIVVEMDVWGECPLRSVVINSKEGVWNRIQPEKPLSGEPKWDTLVFRIDPELFNPDRIGQKIGFGGADSQIWVAEIRCHQP